VIGIILLFIGGWLIAKLLANRRDSEKPDSSSPWRLKALKNSHNEF